MKNSFVGTEFEYNEEFMCTENSIISSFMEAKAVTQS